MPEKETQFFRTEEGPKPNGFEKSQEPWIEQIEADNNKVKIGYALGER